MKKINFENAANIFMKTTIILGIITCLFECITIIQGGSIDKINVVFAYFICGMYFIEKYYEFFGDNNNKLLF